MENVIAIYQDMPLTTAADSNDIVVQLFVQTKRSEKTRIQYSHSTAMFCDLISKPLASMTLQDAVNLSQLRQRTLQQPAQRQAAYQCGEGPLCLWGEAHLLEN